MANKKRKNGEGTVRLRKDGRWEGRIVVGYADNGNPRTKSILAKTKTECLEKLEELKEQCGRTSDKLKPDMPFGDWIDFWYQNFSKPKIRQTTQLSYEGRIYTHIIPEIGKIPLNKLTQNDMQQFYARLKKGGRKRFVEQYGEGLSDRMVRSCHATCRTALEKAVAEGLITNNPAIGCRLPPKKAKEMQILTEAQIQTFMEAIKKDEIWGDFFYLELMTGLRRGEICALKWSGFDAAEGKLSVSRTLHEDGTTGDTKTYSGTRTITLPKSAADMLRERKQTAISEWIFPNPLKPEKAVSGNKAYTRLKKILKEYNLPDIRFHDLRHTFATQAVAGGVDPKSLSHLLRHTKASFSLDRYTHVTSEMQESAAAVMGSFLDKIIGKEVDGWAEEKTAREA